MAQPVETLLQFFQSFSARNHLPFQFHVNVPVIIFSNYTGESTPCNTILSIIIPTLLGFVQILCTGKNEPFPFQAHSRATTMTCVFSMVLHYLAFKARNWFPNYSSQLGVAMDVTASVSVASLVSLIVLDSWWPIRYILYILLVVAELHQCLKRMFDKYFGGFFHQQRPWRMMTEDRLLPETYMDTQVYGNPYQRARRMITAPVRQPYF